MSDKDKEQFKTYYERKRMRKHSLFGASKEAFLFAAVMLGGMIPVGLLFVYADKLGVWWWILLLIYTGLMAMAIYAIYRYREIVGMRGYYSEEEFRKVFAKELLLVKVMDRLQRFLIH